jgi:hypothetical protein
MTGCNDLDAWFIVRAVRGEPGISLADLWERHRDHSGLSDERAANDVLRVLKMGYISATAVMTEEGKQWLAAGN